MSDKNKKKQSSGETISPKKVLLKKKSTSAVKKKSQPADKVINRSAAAPGIINDDIIDPSALARGDEPMTIIDHLNELRSRLLYVIASFFIITCIAFYFSDYLVHLVNRPFLETGNKLNVFTIAGGFIIRMKVSAAIALLITLPLIVFHIWRFISPAIDKPVRIFSRIIMLSAVMLFYSGVTFVFLVLPLTINVLLGFIDPSMLNTIDANNYLHFIFFLSFIMGFICELPVIILILTKLGLITPQFLISKRKYAIVIIWITAAIVTPGADLLSQSLVGIPLMLLYEISIVISRIVLIRKKRKELLLDNSATA